MLGDATWTTNVAVRDFSGALINQKCSQKPTIAATAVAVGSTSTDMQTPPLNGALRPCRHATVCAQLPLEFTSLGISPDIVSSLQRLPTACHGDTLELHRWRNFFSQLVWNCDSEIEKARVGNALDVDLAESAPNDVICSLFGAEFTRRHLACLQPEGWLNDEVVNGYLRMVQQRCDQQVGKSEAALSRIWCPNSFFWPKLKEHGYEGVRRWSTRAAISVVSLQAILLPLHLDKTHWALAVIDFRRHGILYCDSLGRTAPASLQPRLQEFLDGELAAKECPKELKGQWPMLRCDELSHGAALPVQRNDSDCGVFMCAYAERFAAGEAIDFDTSPAAVEQMRRGMAASILSGRL